VGSGFPRSVCLGAAILYDELILSEHSCASAAKAKFRVLTRCLVIPIVDIFDCPSVPPKSGTAALGSRERQRA
jgi:hypothetical protein